MIHGLFGGMGSIVGGFYDRYDRARFYYRDATASDDVSESYRDGVCIDNGLDYAVTIPINSFLFQYYIRLCNIVVIQIIKIAQKTVNGK